MMNKTMMNELQRLFKVIGNEENIGINIGNSNKESDDTIESEIKAFRRLRKIIENDKFNHF